MDLRRAGVVKKKPGPLGIDFSPLRVSSAYRRLYVYGVVSSIASQATYVTVMYQMKQITGSPLAVGAIGAAELLPMILLGLYGGVIADHFNRQRVVLFFEVAMLAVMGALWFNSRLVHPSVVALYVIAAAVAAIGSAQSPSLAALTQQLVPHELQRQSSTLQMIARTGGSILGPGLGGLVAATWSPSVVYLADVVSFSLTLFFLVGLRVANSNEDSDRPSFASMLAGARYAARRPDVLGTYVVDLIAMTFAFPVAVLPFVAGGFHSHYALALLYSGLPIGAFLATISSRWSARVHHYGRAVIYAAVLWGVGIAIFGIANSLSLAFVGLVVAGAADAVSGIFRMTLWNESIPLGVRGRMAGIEMLSYSVGPTVGSLRVGAMTAWLGRKSAVVIGAVVCAGGCAVVPVAMRAVWDFDARSDPNVAAVASERRLEVFD